MMTTILVGISTSLGSSKSKSKLSTVSGAFAQDDFTIKLGGRLHVDYATASSDNTDFDVSATALRRALIERAAFMDAFQLDRRVGFDVSTKSDNYQVQLGVFGENLEEIENNDGNEGIAVAGRAVYKFDVSGGLIHTGASFRYREQNDSADLRYRQRTFVEQTGRIISTGRVVDNDTFFGGELVGLFGSAWAIGEYTVVNANGVEGSTVCTEDPSSTGWSIGGGYVFGGKRNYSVGKFKRVTVYNSIFRASQALNSR